MSTATVRLYRDDSYLIHFGASVVAAKPDGKGLVEVELDQTAFYPTGGGQPFDSGSLDGRNVVDVRDAGAGRILHIVEGDVTVGGKIEGQVDWSRRFDHMQQHTGQHILSRAFVNVAKAATTSFHLGATSCTLDIDLPDATDGTVREAERVANSVIFANAQVSMGTLPADKAGSIAEDMELVRELALKPGDPIRIIRVGDFDRTPCGGTHVKHAGEVGSVVIRGWERFKGGTRVTFFCGERVVKLMAELSGIVDECVSRLSVRPEEIPGTLDRLHEQASESRRTIRALSEALATAEAAALDSDARQVGDHRVIVEIFDGRDIAEVQLLAQKITSLPGRFALLAAPDRKSGKASIVFARSSEGIAIEIKMGDLVGSMCRSRGGKGGGSATLARGGGIPAGTATSLLEDAFAQISGQVGT